MLRKVRLTKDNWYRVGREYVLCRDGLDDSEILNLPKLMKHYQLLGVPLKYSTLLLNSHWFKDLQATPIDEMFPVLFYAPSFGKTEDGRSLCLREAQYSFLQMTEDLTSTWHIVPTVHIGHVRETISRQLTYDAYLTKLKAEFADSLSLVIDTLGHLKGWRR